MQPAYQVSEVFVVAHRSDNALVCVCPSLEAAMRKAYTVLKQEIKAGKMPGTLDSFLFRATDVQNDDQTHWELFWKEWGYSITKVPLSV